MTMINEFTSLVADVTVRRGDTGNSVKTLQTLLNYRGAGLTVDGVFGATTEARVIEFQRAIGLSADGIVGPITWNAVRNGMVVARISGSAINMRATPDRTAAVVQTLASQDQVKIITRSQLLAEDYRWFQVEAKQKTGWVREDLVRVYSPFTVPLPVVNNVTIQIRPRPWTMDIDPLLEAGIRSALNLGFRDRVRYMYYSLDFDTSNPKGMALVYLPTIGGTGGSTMLVLQSTASGYRLVSRLPGVQQFVIITPQKTKGYPDLVVYTSGGGIPSAYRRLQFNGSGYPFPSEQPPLSAGTTLSGAALASRITPELAAPLVAV